MANDGEVQVGKPNSLPEKQCNMQDNEQSPQAYTESQSGSHLLAFLCTEQNMYIYVYSHDYIGSMLMETHSITFLATCPPQPSWPTFQSALLSCKCLGPSHTGISYHRTTPSPESIYSSLSEVHLFTKLYSVPWRSTDSDFLGMEMRKEFQTCGPSVRRCSLQHLDG